MESLNLYATQISDSGLEHLAKLPNLRRLYAWDTQVTKDGASMFMEDAGMVEVNLGYEVNVVDSLTVEVKPIAVSN